MNISPHHPLFARIASDLADHGWSQQNIFLPEALTRELAEDCRQRALAGALTPAATGRGGSVQVREAIRGDAIEWVEPGQGAASDRYLMIMESLRQGLNQALYLGLEDFEGHYACYPPGAYYRRHLDRFNDDDRRSVSTVLYLNSAWLPEDGGQLRLYLPGERTHDVVPTGGALVVFLSAEIPHEVLPARRERLSLTGWFRRRGERPL
ncbi:2OG-Fe(II) oxygenase [Pseudomonas sp. RIT-PI-S]|uniref:2OG-Fe(II) oxygenase n=1 Tax=Pseudomonas sp. RIT-PI-S TaxID=3035295 RepID=UPI0021D80D6B|nr:2OG-Fe(II) oxygenase [Pseudomonas sp. RIT-PI-S]